MRSVFAQFLKVEVPDSSPGVWTNRRAGLSTKTRIIAMHFSQFQLKMKFHVWGGLVCSAAWLLGCAQLPAPASQPEVASGYTEKKGWVGHRFAVAAANPLAAQAGEAILKAEGSAVDSAIAVQMVLSLVEPQSSGIGGGAFLLHYDGQEVQAFDGRETAPAGVNEKLFLKENGQPMPLQEAIVGGRAVGVPGVVRMLELAHQRHGKLPWAKLFEPAIALAEKGFPISPRLNTLLENDVHLKKDPTSAAYFYQADGRAHAVGHVLRNLELAQVLHQIANLGARALHEGAVAQAIVNKVRGHATNPGVMSLADLASYQPKVRKPLCHEHIAKAQNYKVCGFPPPSSGAIAVGQILGLLSRLSADALALENGVPTADWLHLYLESSRLAFADRAQHVGDPDFVAAPGDGWGSLLAPRYLTQRAQLVGPQSMGVAPPGNPGLTQSVYGLNSPEIEHGTTHISIIDADGRAVAMTSTIEDQFGSRQMVRGFLLNNQLTDFSLTPTNAQGVPVANRVEPGKRPRSSMSPTLVFDANTQRLVMTGGSPGGAAIIHYTTKMLYGVLNWGLTPQQAINLPNFGSLHGPSLLEEGRFTSITLQALRLRGAEVREQPMTSGLQAIKKSPTGLAGGADPRREGVVLGE
jgi:gamma-glutamyltranspeptidase / glutathione hydrolase